MSFINVNSIPDLLLLSFIVQYIIEQLKNYINKNKHYHIILFLINFTLSMTCLYFCNQTLFTTSNQIFNYILTSFFMTSNASGIYDLLDFINKQDNKKEQKTISEHINKKPIEKSINWKKSPYKNIEVKNIKGIHISHE